MAPGLQRSDSATPASGARRRRRPVAVRIGGKEYRVLTEDDEELLQRVALRVDEAMARVRDRTETVDSLDLAVLTALNLARELTLLKDVAGGAGETRRLREIVELAEDALRGPLPG